MKIKLTYFYPIISSILLVLPGFSMQVGGGKSALQQINEVFSLHPEMYDFSEQEPGFSSNLGAKNRLKELERRKCAIVEKELLFKLERHLQLIKDENILAIGPLNISRDTMAALCRNVLIPAATFFLEGKLIKPSDQILPTSEMVAYARYNQEVSDQKQIIGIGFACIKTGLDAHIQPKNYPSSEHELTSIKDDIIHALAHDPFKEDEDKTLTILPTLPTAMRKNVLETLFKRRSATGKDARILKDYLEHCLTMPQSYKRLFPDFCGSIEEFNTQRENFLDEKFNTSPWRNYSSTTKPLLKNAIRQLCNEAEKGHLKKSTTRKILFFYGAPATGKSLAAESVANLFGLTRTQLSFNSAEDLSQGNLTGNSSCFDAKLGKIFQPFYVKDKNGCTWKNPVVIIEEFDRMLKKDGLMPFMLRLLDPNVTSLKCDYFGQDVDFDISGLIVILTANTDLGKKDGEKEPKISFDPLAAIRDRLIFVHFDGLDPETKRDILHKYIDDNMLIAFSPCFSDSNHEDHKQNIVNYVLENYPHDSNREMKRKIDILVNTPKNNWAAIRF